MSELKGLAKFSERYPKVRALFRVIPHPGPGVRPRAFERYCLNDTAFTMSVSIYIKPKREKYQEYTLTSVFIFTSLRRVLSVADKL